MTKHGQTIRAGFIKEFLYIEHVQTGNTNSLIKPLQIAEPFQNFPVGLTCFARFQDCRLVITNFTRFQEFRLKFANFPSFLDFQVECFYTDRFTDFEMEFT